MRATGTWVLCALALAGAGGGSGWAEPTVTVNTTHYDIQGKNADQLKRQMKRLGPNGFWAYTSWYIRWSGSCAVSLEIDYTYPRWTDRDSAPSRLRERWDRMLTNLTLHEEGHGQIGLDAAREIHDTQCEGDPTKIIDKWVRYEKKYDKETRHGAGQGVTLD